MSILVLNCRSDDLHLFDSGPEREQNRSPKCFLRLPHPRTGLLFASRLTFY